MEVEAAAAACVVNMLKHKHTLVDDDEGRCKSLLLASQSLGPLNHIL